jgi:hypothetical protein
MSAFPPRIVVVVLFVSILLAWNPSPVKGFQVSTAIHDRCRHRCGQQREQQQQNEGVILNFKMTSLSMTKNHDNDSKANSNVPKPKNFFDDLRGMISNFDDVIDDFVYKRMGAGEQWYGKRRYNPSGRVDGDYNGMGRSDYFRIEVARVQKEEMELRKQRRLQEEEEEEEKYGSSKRTRNIRRNNNSDDDPSTSLRGGALFMTTDDDDHDDKGTTSSSTCAVIGVGVLGTSLCRQILEHPQFQDWKGNEASSSTKEFRYWSYFVLLTSFFCLRFFYFSIFTTQ